ncbi:hypothetical protein EVJ58_g7673 [Rhodofomes roseus]|uniref:Uncharacterized protein n=1 Tax=Rhodofomes roseus TaxID=34475 RepID=A0A4Y9Y1Q8_9APHY|nr:hypothetical protein EVJ58_g7673 [Rhodofomes roseus]
MLTPHTVTFVDPVSIGLSVLAWQAAYRIVALPGQCSILTYGMLFARFNVHQIKMSQYVPRLNTTVSIRHQFCLRITDAHQASGSSRLVPCVNVPPASAGMHAPGRYNVYLTENTLGASPL